MTRSNTVNLHPFDPEIERTLHRRLRKHIEDSGSDSDSIFSHNLFELDSDLDFVNMAGRTLRELAAPDVTYNALCINYPDVAVPFELKSGLIHLLPKFNGLAGEDPHKHLKEFHIVCSTMKPQGIPEEHIKLRAFPFSLQDAAKDWLYYLQPSSVENWNDLKKLFLEKFFPASRAASIRKEICGIRQNSTESLHEYWERFKKLCASCPHHQISEQLLIQYFYEGLLPMDRNIMDAASGGALVDKTPTDARALIENMSINSQQFTTRSNSTVLTRGVNEVQAIDHKGLENRLDELTVLVKKLATGQTARVCGICTSAEHPTDSCPTLQEDSNADTPQAYAANIFNPQANVDLSSNRYHPSWRNHPNLRWGNPVAQQQQLRQQTNPSQAAARPEPSLEDLVKQMAAQNLQFQQRTDSSIQNLQTQIGQIATTINQMQAQGADQLPSQTVVNPNAPNPNVSAITLRSGKAVDTPKVLETAVLKNRKALEPDDDEEYIPPLPFPQRASISKKQDEADRDNEILDTFRKVEVNIPLLEAIKQIPKYARFLKELCTYKRKRRLKGIEKVNVGYNVSALMLPMPQKCNDPGTFSIPCTIGSSHFDDAMLDLGASINVMPTSIFNSLALGPLQETGVTIQLANRSNARPAGLVEDVLVKVNNLIFPADFYILDMEEETKSSRSPIILGRPFLRTAKTKIDVHAGTLSMEFGDTTEKFNIFNVKKHLMEELSLCKIELFNGLVDTLQVDTPPIADIVDVVAAIEQPLVLELEPPPKNFNFAYSEGSGKLHETNIAGLKSEQEKKLPILRKHKSDIGLTLPGIPAKKVWKAKHDKMIYKKEFSIGLRVLWFRPRLKIMAGKHRSKWIGPFVITNIFTHGVVEIKSEATNKVFKVDGKRLKLFYESSTTDDATIRELSLEHPTYTEV